MLKKLFAILLLFFSSISQANTVCTELNEIAGVEWGLQQFDRVEGDFQYAGNTMEMITAAEKVIHAPQFSYAMTKDLSAKEVPGPTRMFMNKDGAAIVLTMAITYSARDQIQQIIDAASWEKYKDIHIFDFMKFSLGLDKAGFCSDEQIQKTVSMFMASVAEALPGNGVTQVYYLTNLGALALMKNKSRYIEFIYPDPKHIDALIHLRIFSEVEKIKSEIQPIKQ